MLRNKMMMKSSSCFMFLCSLLLCFLFDASQSHELLVHPLEVTDVTHLLTTFITTPDDGCRIIQQPVLSPNVTIGSDINISIIVANCTAIFLNVSGTTIQPNSDEFDQYDLNTNKSKLGDRSEFTKGVYLIVNASTEDNGKRIQFVVHHKGKNPVLSNISTLRVQGPPGPVDDLQCNFITQDVLHVSYNIPNGTLGGIHTWYSINASWMNVPLSLINDTAINVTLTNVSLLDLYRPYSVAVNSVNSVSSGPTAICSVFIPNLTQIANIQVDITIVKNTAHLLLTTQLLNTEDYPLCPGCYPTSVDMFINKVNDHVSYPIQFTVPPNQITFEKNTTIPKNIHFTAIIYYCNVVGCVSTFITKQLSTFDMRSVNVVTTDDNHNICVTCMFTTGSTATGCELQIHDGVDALLTLTTSTHVINSTVHECFNVPAHNESEWKAFATNGTSLLSKKAAFTGILIYKPLAINPATNQPTSSPTAKPTSPPNKVPYGAVVAIIIVAVIIVVLFIVGGTMVVILIKRKAPCHQEFAQLTNLGSYENGHVMFPKLELVQQEQGHCVTDSLIVPDPPTQQLPTEVTTESNNYRKKRPPNLTLFTNLTRSTPSSPIDICPSTIYNPMTPPVYLHAPPPSFVTTLPKHPSWPQLPIKE